MEGENIFSTSFRESYHRLIGPDLHGGIAEDVTAVETPAKGTGFPLTGCCDPWGCGDLRHHMRLANALPGHGVVIQGTDKFPVQVC